MLMMLTSFTGASKHVLPTVLVIPMVVMMVMKMIVTMTILVTVMIVSMMMTFVSMMTFVPMMIFVPMMTTFVCKDALHGLPVMAHHGKVPESGRVHH